jgi:hypothetical protein
MCYSSCLACRMALHDTDFRVYGVSGYGKLLQNHQPLYLSNKLILWIDKMCVKSVVNSCNACSSWSQLKYVHSSSQLSTQLNADKADKMKLVRFYWRWFGRTCEIKIACKAYGLLCVLAATHFADLILHGLMGIMNFVHASESSLKFIKQPLCLIRISVLIVS